MSLYLGDFPLAGTVEFGFNTRTLANVPITLAGAPTIAVYKAAATSALTLDPAPVLDEALGAVVGLHHVTVSLADADFTAGEYKVVLSAGTVDGVSVVGTVLAHFSINNRTEAAVATELAKVPKSDGTATWNDTAKATLQAEANDALVANNLDHLALTATGGTDMTTEVADNTVLSRILGNGDTSTFVPSTDGLHAAGVDLDAILFDTGTTLDGRIPAALTSNGNMKCSLIEIMTVALTGTAAQIAAAFIKFFDKAAPTGTINSLPDAVPGATGGLPTTNGTKVSQTVDLTSGQSIAVSDKTGFSLSATGADAITSTSTFAVAMAAAAWNALTSGMVTVGSVGKKLADWVVGTIDTYTGNTKQTGDAYALLGTVHTDIDAILADTNELQTDWANGGRLDLLLDTASAGAGLTAQQTRDSMKLAPSVGDPAAGSVDAHLDAAALEATLAAIKGAGWSTETLAAIDVLIDAIKAKTDTIGTVSVTVVSPVASTGDIAIVAGDTYDIDDGREITWTQSGTWPSLSGATVVFDCGDVSVACTVSGADPNQVITLELTAAQTLALTPGSYVYQVRATLSGGHVVTIVSGGMLVEAQI